MEIFYTILWIIFLVVAIEIVGKLGEEFIYDYYSKKEREKIRKVMDSKDHQ